MKLIEMGSPDALVARIEVKDHESYGGYREIGRLKIDNQDDLDYFRKIRERIED